jgi:predicted dehydrogenase
MSALRALIIGCGNIAGGFDSQRKGDELPLTHAGAYRRDGRFDIVGCVEPDEARRKTFMKDWGVKQGFTRVEETKERYDVVSICSPTASHVTDIAAALAMQPKIIFCEKPVARSAQETEATVHRCESAHVPLAVNYTRRWDPAVADLGEAILGKRWGELRAVSGYYNKGLLNNGSHMLDLLLLLLGPLRVCAVGLPVEDFKPEDPSVPVWLQTKDQVPVHIACGHADDFALFELQFVFARAAITMEEGGMAWRERHVHASQHFSGYRTLDTGERRDGSYAKAMLRAAHNIHAAATAGSPLASTGDSALAAQRLCEEIRKP